MKIKYVDLLHSFCSLSQRIGADLFKFFSFWKFSIYYLIMIYFWNFNNLTTSMLPLYICYCNEFCFYDLPLKCWCPLQMLWSFNTLFTLIFLLVLMMMNEEKVALQQICGGLLFLQVSFQHHLLAPH